MASLPSGHPYKSAAPSASLSVALTSPTNGQAILAGASVAATATAAGGTAPYTVKFYLDGSGSPASTTPNATSPLTVNLGVLSTGSHTVHATVTDSTSTTVSSGTAVPFSVIVDTTAPTPNPMTFAGNPVSNNATSLSMTATTATDALNPPVQYYFENTTNSNNSGWISSPTWTNTGLTTGVTYSFRVKARDAATTPNQTAFSSTLTAVPVNVTGLRCEDLVAPVGVDLLQPALSWQYEDTAFTRGQKQTAYRILVASTAANLAANQGDLWDSGQVASEQSTRVPYAGTALTSRQRCHWKVRVWDKDGSPSAWSAPSEWTMGLLNPAAWTAKWIGNPASGLVGTDTPYVRKTFDLVAIPSSALASVNVMGFYELYVNGVKVSPNILGPALTNYGKRSLYETYDLVPYLRIGRNCIGLWLSRGWRSTPIARMQLDMVVDGGPLRIATGGEWRCKPSGRTILGPWQWNNFGGEQVDARLDDPLWSDPATSDSNWLTVAEVTAPAIPAEAQKSPPMRVLKTIPAVSSTALADGSFRLDFGTQLTGWLKLRLRGQAAGNTITIEYADKLEPLQTYNQIDRYICAGKPLEEFCSKFNYRGFRWAIIKGLATAPVLADAEALLIGADFETRGGFACSSDQFNRMHQVNLWTIQCLSQSGFLSDCPHRERIGYGDGQVSIESCTMNFMMRPFYSKWSTDWSDNANPSTGYVGHTAPQLNAGGGGPGWGGALQAMTWRNYLYYQDKQILERNLDACLRHIEAIETHATNGVVRAFGGQWDFIGDWVPPERGLDTNNWPPQPAAELFNNCYRLYLREQWAQMAEVLGRQDEANACRAELARLRPLVHAAFYDSTKKFYVLDEQAYYLMPLMTGVVPEELRPTIMNKLEECIRVTRRGHLDTGMLGTYFLINYLTEMGRNDLLHLIVSQKEYPGWGYMLEQGATTWWEQWNGYWSQIHSVFTSLDSWFYQGLAGIRPDPANPGFKHIILKPAVVGDLTWVDCHHDSPYGRIISKWLRVGQQLTMEVTIPPNSTAEIHVPASAVGDVTESGQAVSGVPGVQFLRMENRHAVFAAGSGSYVFSGTLPTTHGPVVDVPTGSPLALDFLGSQTITTLLLGGVIQPPGTYNAITHPAWFTGTGSLLVMAPVVTPQSRTWDNGASTGAWNDTDANWTGQTWMPGAAATLAHSATASTITLSSGLTAASVTIGNGTNNANYTFTGGLLTATGFTLQANTDNNLGTASYPTTTLNNTTLSVTSLVIGRGQLVIDGSSTVTASTIGGPGGDTNGAWGQLTIAGTANVTATNGISAGSTAWGLNLNGGTLTTKSLDYGPQSYFGSTNLNFNGTWVKANQNNPNFITVSGGLDSGFNPEIKAGGAKIDTNGFDIGIQVALQGSGTLTKSGTGTLKLGTSTIASTYGGGTMIDGGTVMVDQFQAIAGGATALGAAAPTNVVTINNGGVLTGNYFNWLDSTALASGGTNAHAVVVNVGGTLKGAAGFITGLGNTALNGGTIEISNGLVYAPDGWNGSFSLGGDITVSGSVVSSITTTSGAGASANLQMSNGANGVGGTRTITVNDVTTSPASDLIVSARLANGTVVKAGAGTLELAAGATGTGTAVSWQVNDDKLLVDAGVTAGPVSVASGATLGGNGNIGGNVTIASGAHHALAVAAAPTAQVTRAITGTLTLTSGNILDLTAASTPAAGVYVLATATTAITGTPTTINYNGISGTVSVDSASTPKRLLLTVTSTGGYATWAATHAPGTNPSQDQDGDGVNNAVEYVLGGTATTKDLVKLPAISTSGGNLLFTFKRAQASIDGTTSMTIEVGTDLATWPSTYAVPDGASANNPGVSVFKDASPSFDTVTLSIPHAPGTRKFARLKVLVPIP